MPNPSELIEKLEAAETGSRELGAAPRGRPGIDVGVCGNCYPTGQLVNGETCDHRPHIKEGSSHG